MMGGVQKKWHCCLKSTVVVIGVIFSIYFVYYPLRNQNHSFQSDAVLEDSRRDISLRNLPPDVTVVTAYFNLGKFKKGASLIYTPSLYTRWMQVFSRLNNTLIVFTDSSDVYNLFIKLRQKFDNRQSQIYLINRTELWSFSLASEIRHIFNQPKYPKFQPNTVNENYSCVMHAKYELIKKVIKERMYNTRYLCWLDIGLFRDIAGNNGTFPIQIPPLFNQDKIAFSGVNEFDPKLSARNIIIRNLVWVSGAMFIGRSDMMSLFADDYMKAVRQLLDERIMSTDQQVIYSMFLPNFNFKPRIDIQIYTTRNHADWFYLGYLIKDIWDKNQKRITPRI